MTSADWNAIIRAFQKAVADIRDNVAAPATTPMDMAAVAATLSRINAVLPAWIAVLRAHEGVITGLGDILTALSSAGVPYASDIETAVLAVPGAMDAAEKWMPTIIWALSEVQPAPTWRPGPDQYAR